MSDSVTGAGDGAVGASLQPASATIVAAITKDKRFIRPPYRPDG